MRTVIRSSVLGAFTVHCWTLSDGSTIVRAQAPAPQTSSTNALALHVFQDAVANARAANARLTQAQTPAAAPAPRAPRGNAPAARTPSGPPGNAQYQDGLAKLQAGQLMEAQAAMQAALRVNPNSALYHGDLAAVQIALQMVDEASLELVRARQLQADNQFYTIALGAVKALRQQWMDASLNLDAAVAADSGVIDSTLAEAGVAWAWRARRNMQAKDWALVATTRWPSLAEPWLRLASVYRQQRDTTRGLQAIERYSQLRPDDHAGQMLHAVFLYDLGRMDSAVVFATAAAQDSTNREQAGIILYNIGARTFQAAQDTAVAARPLAMGRLDLAIAALANAKPIASPELRPRIALFLGYAQLQKVAALDQLAEQNRQCEPAQALDSLLTRAGENLRDGEALDSLRVRPILSSTLPQYRVRAQGLVNTICGRRP